MKKELTKQEKYKLNQLAKGQVQSQLWIYPEHRKELAEFAKYLRWKHETSKQRRRT